MTNSSTQPAATSLAFAPLLPALQWTISQASAHEFNDPHLAVAGMEMLGVCYVPAPNQTRKVNEIAEALGLAHCDIHFMHDIRRHELPACYYYVSKKTYRELFAVN